MERRRDTRDPLWRSLFSPPPQPCCRRRPGGGGPRSHLDDVFVGAGNCAAELLDEAGSRACLARSGQAALVLLRRILNSRRISRPNGPANYSASPSNVLGDIDAAHQAYQEAYLSRYPGTEDSRRVEQRLAGLATPTDTT